MQYTPLFQHLSTSPDMLKHGMGHAWTEYVKKTYRTYTFDKSNILLDFHLKSHTDVLDAQTFDNLVEILVHTNNLNSKDKDVQPEQSGRLLRAIYEKSSKDAHAVEVTKDTLRRWFILDEELVFLNCKPDDYTVVNTFYSDNPLQLYRQLWWASGGSKVKNMFGTDNDAAVSKPLVQYLFTKNGLESLKALLETQDYSPSIFSSFEISLSNSIKDLNVILDLVSSDEYKRAEAIVVLLELAKLIDAHKEAYKYHSYTAESIVLLEKLEQESPTTYSKYQTLTSLGVDFNASDLVVEVNDTTEPLPTFD